MLRSALLYLVLVGVPFAGLFVILQIGDELEPPAHVGGAWFVAEPDEPSACEVLVPESAITIDQSGRFLRVRLPDRAPAKGRYEGGVVRARVAAIDGACAGREVDLEARLSDDGEALVGTASATGCAACPTSNFVARREKAKR